MKNYIITPSRWLIKKASDEKMVTQPFFSIIITTYNRAHLISRALNSLVSQTEKDWEAFIVDDGSTDDTYSQVLPYLKAYPQIKFLKKVHSGEAISKNEGIEASTGKFISFLDSDDEYNPIHLETRRAILEQKPLVKFLYGGITVIGNQFVPDRYDLSKKINIKNCVIGGTFFIERNILISLSGFKEIFIGTDADLFERAKKTEIIFMKTGLPTYIYHHENADSLTNKLYLNSHSQSEQPMK